MEGARRPSLLFLLLVLQPGCNEMEVAAIAEESVQLQPVKLPEPGTGITWKVTLDSAETYRIVTFNEGEPPDHGAAPHFINRVTFHPENLSLQIDPVKKSDSGLYTLLIDIGGGREDITKFRVSLGQCNVTLSCSVPGADRVTYDWSRGGAVVPNESILHISLSPRDAHLAVTCTAQNPASNSSTTASAKDLCAGNSVCRIALPSAHSGETPVIRTDGRPLCLPLAVRMEGARRPSLLFLLLVLQPDGE
uniref:Ig-like domain-containing protein n=1 Tax=Chrysemys picta bellii TaxID=8478 RepID=A0A8C3IRU3_CHRPI